MKFRNSLIASLVVLLLMLGLLIATKFDSQSWPEPTTDIEYHLRGLLIPMGWFMAVAASLLTFMLLMLLGLVKTAVIRIYCYLNKSAI
jgi:hypothetical protein